VKLVFGSVRALGFEALTEIPPTHDEPFHTAGGVQVLQFGGLLAPFAHGCGIMQVFQLLFQVPLLQV
jgi:hypothetical protein